MTDRYDVIVVGVGALGSAATYHLARRGVDVLGLERHGIPNSMGSYHGMTRGHSLTKPRPDYVPMAERALTLWEHLSEEAGERLFRRTGHLRGWPGGDGRAYRGGFEDACEVLDDAGIEFETLTGAETNDRWPGYDLPPEHDVIYQPDSGVLDSELTVSTYVRQAFRHGAEIRAHEPVVDWHHSTESVRVRTSKGSYEADDLVVTAGAWAATLVDEFDGLLVPERRTMAWFQPDDPDRFHPDRFPAFSLDVEEGYYYGAPIHRAPGVKLGNRPLVREVIDPDRMCRAATASEEEVLRRFAERYFPDGAGPTTRMTACTITMTPDERFVIDRHPTYDRVAVAGGFSGSGFHVSSAGGELLADIVTDTEPTLDPETFSLDRVR